MHDGEGDDRRPSKIQTQIRSFSKKFSAVEAAVTTGRARCLLTAAHGAKPLNIVLDKFGPHTTLKVVPKSITMVNQAVTVSGVLANNRQCDKNEFYLGNAAQPTEFRFNSIPVESIESLAPAGKGGGRADEESLPDASGTNSFVEPTAERLELLFFLMNCGLRPI